MALTEENLLFLEAWRTIDRAYVDKNFNGQSWFRYRENALRNEPMNNREETCINTPAFLYVLACSHLLSCIVVVEFAPLFIYDDVYLCNEVRATNSSHNIRTFCELLSNRKDK